MTCPKTQAEIDAAIAELENLQGITQTTMDGESLSLDPKSIERRLRSLRNQSAVAHHNGSARPFMLNARFPYLG